MSLAHCCDDILISNPIMNGRGVSPDYALKTSPTSAMIEITIRRIL